MGEAGDDRGCSERGLGVRGDSNLSNSQGDMIGCHHLGWRAEAAIVVGKLLRNAGFVIAILFCFTTSSHSLDPAKLKQMDAEFSEIMNKMGHHRAKTKSYHLSVSELFDPMIMNHTLPVLRDYLNTRYGLGETYNANGFGENVTIKGLSLFRHS